MTDTRTALVDARKGARTAADVIEAQTRIEWYNRHKGAEPCPAEKIPTLETLKGWVPEYPDEVPIEAAEIEAAHERWLEELKDWGKGRQGNQPRHPLAPSIRAWFGKVAPNQRPTGILPGSFHTARTNVPSLPLRLGTVRSQGRGAALAKRIWWAVIANTPIEERRPDSSTLLATTLRDVGAWLYPGGRGLRRRDLPRLRDALAEADGIRIDWNGQALQCVRVKARPATQTALDAPLPFRVRLPPGSDRGPMIQLDVLYRCGTISEPVFDAWIRLAYVWDVAKRNNGGRRVYATRPRVLRDERGRLIDESGKLILGPNPVLPASKRRAIPRDRPATNWHDARAIPTGEEERSPAAERVPVLNHDDTLRLLYGPEAMRVTREKVKVARRIIRGQLERRGYVVIEDFRRGGIRILEPRSNSDRQLSLFRPISPF